MTVASDARLSASHSDEPTLCPEDERILDRLGFADIDTRTDSTIKYIGPYRFERRLGTGGCGVVDLCWDDGLNRPIAIKRLRSDILRAAEARAWLEREGRRQAKLKHPNIVSVLGVSNHHEEPFLVFEYIAGPTLKQWLAERWAAGRPTLPRTVADLVRNLARAAQHAHEQGVIHADIKPANVLLRSESERTDETTLVPLLTDFGFARLLDQPGSPDDSIAGGTPHYMAPEQARGERGVLTPCVDVWALGIVLYELITGRRPFEGTSEEVRAQIQSDPVPPLTRFRRDVPADLAAICHRCLRKDPDQRYARAGDLADDLERFLRDCPVLARPLHPLARCWRWAGRNKVLATLYAVSVLAVLVVLALALFLAVTVTAARGEREPADVRQEESRFLADGIPLWSEHLVAVGTRVMEDLSP